MSDLSSAGQDKAVRVLAAALADLPGMTAIDQSGSRPTVSFQHHDRRLTLYPVWTGEGFPRDVERASQTVRKHADRSTLTVFVGRRFSPGARTFLNERRTSWADATGAVRIDTPGLLLVRDSGATRAAPHASALKGVRWSPSAGAVAEFLLHMGAEVGPRGPDISGALLPRAVDIAESTGWSPPQVVKVLQQFDEEGWTRKEGHDRGPGSRRSLTDSPALLSAWAGWHRRRHLVEAKMHATWRDPFDFLSGPILGRLPIRAVAVSGWAALQTLTPFMSDVPTLTIYLEPALYDTQMAELAREAELRPVDKGARVTFIRAEPHVLRQSQRARGLPLVSDVRLYGDLLRLGVRGDDAAEHLREMRIGL